VASAAGELHPQAICVSFVSYTSGGFRMIQDEPRVFQSRRLRHCMPVSEAEVKPDKPFGGTGVPLAPKELGDVDRATFSVAVKSASPLTMPLRRANDLAKA
jgi:hypothetical protein